MNSVYYVLEGKEVVPATGFDDPRVVALFDNDNALRRVGKTVVGRFTVYTTFLVINHAFMDGPPLVFETMICDKLGNWLNYQDHYSTWEEAEAGHLAAIEWAKDNPISWRKFVFDWMRQRFGQ